jgi:hypothetical protein
MHADHSNQVFQRYFSGLAEQTFLTRLGVADPPLVDYVSDLLIRFVRSDFMHRIRSSRGRPLTSVTEMAAEARQRLGAASREIHRHIGDFTLFWAGVYPEALQKSEDPFETWCSHGKRAYMIASTIHSDRESGDEIPGDLLERLSDRFELCCYGLREIRREWESGDSGSGGQVWILLN